ncbi:MAG: hypothetical protein AB8H79_12095 [Myxococcota bacterium]
MFRRVSISVAALVAFSIFAVGSASESPEDKAARLQREAEATAQRAAEEAEIEARIVSLEAESTSVTTIVVQADVNANKANGKHWDIGKGKPDPKVTLLVKRTGRALQTAPVKNAFTVSERFADVKVSEGDELYFEVVDDDLGSPDDVGHCTVRFSVNAFEDCELGPGYLSIQFE